MGAQVFYYREESGIEAAVMIEMVGELHTRSNSALRNLDPALCPAGARSVRIPGGSDGLNEPDDDLGGRFTLGSVSGALATPPKVHHMDRRQERWGVPGLATARWAMNRAGP